MRHHHAADQPSRYAPARRVAEHMLARLVLEADVLRLGEMDPEIMRCAGLECLAVLHHRLDRVGVLRSRETLVLGFFARDHGYGERRFGEIALKVADAA